MYFASGSSLPKPTTQGTLDSLAAIEGQKHMYLLMGHTDSVGDQHKELSSQRNEAVAQRLLDSGVAAWRILKIPLGASRPASDNATEAGRQANRRVDVRVIHRSMQEVLYRAVLEEIQSKNLNMAEQYFNTWLSAATERKAILAYFDTRLLPLHNSRTWKGILPKVKAKYYQHPMPELAFKLDSLWAEDQYYRTLGKYIQNLNTWFKEFDEGKTYLDMDPDTSWAEIGRRDSLNMLCLDRLLKQNKLNYPTISQVGERAMQGYFFVLQHAAPPDQIKALLPLLEEQCRRGEFEWLWFAMMTDRLDVNENRSQTYGTQTIEGEEKLWTEEELAEINARRVKIGLTEIKL